MKTKFECFAIGSHVHIGNPDEPPIPATVTAICVRGSNVQYECAWWDGTSRTASWMEEHEVALASKRAGKKLTIGFVKGAT